MLLDYLSFKDSRLGEKVEGIVLAEKNFRVGLDFEGTSGGIRGDVYIILPTGRRDSRYAVVRVISDAVYITKYNSFYKCNKFFFTLIENLEAFYEQIGETPTFGTRLR